MKDEDILAGFASLHEAMAAAFDEFRRDFVGLRGEFADLRNDVSRQILDARNDISRLEQRMLRRFDDVDERLDNHETRITALEART